MAFSYANNDYNSTVKQNVRIVTSLYEPFVMLKDGKLVGFDIDLINEICKQNNLTYSITITSFQDIFTQIEKGRADMAIGCIYVAEEREDIFKFSESYLEGGLVLVVPADSDITTIYELDNKKLGVKKDATGDLFASKIVQKGYPIEIIRYLDTVDSFKALVNGSVDAVLNDYLNSVYLLNKYFSGNIKIAKGRWRDIVYGRKGIAYPISNSNQHLYEIINKSINDLQSSNFIDMVYWKWFAIMPPPNIPQRVMIYTGLVAVSIGITCMVFILYNRRKKIKHLSMIEEHFRNLINDLNVAVYIIQDNSIVLSNHEGAHIAGSSIESIIGHPLDDFFLEYTVINNKEIHYSSFKNLSNMVQEGPMVYRARWKRKDGTVLNVLFRIRHVQWMDNSALECIVNDTTDLTRLLMEREKLKGQLLQSQKLEIIGQITGGIAHDFNNILTVILGYANLLEASVDAKNREAVTKIIEAGNHAKDIVSKLLTFARKKVFLEQEMHLHHIIQNGILLLKTALPKSCTIDIQLHATIDTIVGDTTQIQQMLMNLIINASEAMSEGGTISIETTNVAIEHARIGKVETIHAGNYVLLSIKDTGVGIAEKDIEHIFEPLFTTKEKGSGFGLAIVYGIVKQHRGYIDVVSIPGKGSIFYIYLPVITEHRVETSLKIIDNNKESLPALGGEIVIIDDDANIGSLYKESLHLAGLHAVTFTNAEEMFDYIRTHAITVKLILSDVRMPGISGEQVLEYIKQHCPQIPVVMISGYYDEDMRELLIKKGAKDVWEKMYKIDEIIKKVKGALSS